MQKMYNFNDIQNAEIKFRSISYHLIIDEFVSKLWFSFSSFSRWLRLGLKAQDSDIVPHAIQFATSQGRMKYCRPLFR